MPKVNIHFTPKSLEHLKNMASYLKVETGSAQLAVTYIQQLKDRLISVLGTFPEAGKRVKVHHQSLCQIVISTPHKGYRIFYQIKKQNDGIDLIILAVYRENFPNDSVLMALMENND